MRVLAKLSSAIAFTFAAFLVLTLGLGMTANAATLLSARYDKMSTSIAGATATHEIGFTMQNTAQPVGSLVFEFCSNDPLPSTACTPPNGFDSSATVLDSQTGEAGFTIHANTNSNQIVLTRPPTNPTGITSTYTLSNIVNPSDIGTFYLRLYSFSSTDGTGTAIENGGVALSINEVVDVSTEVPPYLRFCVGVTITAFDCASANSYFIDFGYLSTSQPRFASSQFLAGTNAEFGYSVTVTGTTLTSGSNTIPELLVPAASSPGSSQFGMNLRSNTAPSVGADPVGTGTAAPDPKYDTPNQYAYTDGDIIATVGNADYVRKFTVSYITNISNAQSGGVYATTISYICLANF